MKKLKWFIPGCTAMIAALFLYIPAMAGGYSASSELKVNVIGIRPWPEEPETIEEIRLFMDQKLPQATPSNASKSDAVRANNFYTDTDDDYDDLPDKRLSNASPSNAKHTEVWNDKKEEEKEKENEDSSKEDKIDNLPDQESDEEQEEGLSTPSDGKRAGVLDANAE